MHAHGAGQQVVHHHDPDVLAPGLHAVQPVELGQQGAGVLVQVHVVSRQELLQELGLLVLHGFDDELVVAGHVEERAAGARVGELDQGLAAQGIQVVVGADPEELPEVAEGHGRVGLEAEIVVVVGGGEVAALAGEEDALDDVEVLHEHVPLGLGAEAAHGVSDAQLDGALQRRRRGLFVGGFPRGIHSSVALPDGLGSSWHLGKGKNSENSVFSRIFSHPKYWKRNRKRWKR